MSTITNTRLTELRESALKCQTAVDKNIATKIARDYVDLFEIVLNSMTNIDEDGITYKPVSEFAILAGK